MGGWFDGKIGAPGIVVIFSSTKIAITKQKIDFWPQISKFLGQKSTFSPLAANWRLNDGCFEHEIFTPCPQKLDFGPKKGQNWSKICIFGHFGPNIAIFCSFCPMPDQKTMRTRCLGGFSVM